MGFLDGLLQLGAGLIGGALGGPLGFAIGNLIGGMLFGPKAQAPTVKALDLKLQKTEYGSFIPIFYGTVKSSGIVIDCDDKGGVWKRKDTKKVKTGLFSSTTVAEYRYFLSCAICLGEGVFDVAGGEYGGNGALIVDQLFYGDTLLYDRNGATLQKKGYDLTFDSLSGAESGTGSNGIGNGTTTNFLALYRGTWTQQPDPELAALHNGVVPAYRGQGYVRLKKLPLRPFDNELRPLSAVMRRVDKDGNTVEEVRKMVYLHMRRGGVPDANISLTKISGTVSGAFMTQKGAPRELCERLVGYKFCDLAQVGDQIIDTDRANPDIFAVAAKDLGAHLVSGGGGDDTPSSTRNFDVDDELPSSLSVTFQDSNNNYEVSTAHAPRQTATHEKIETVDLPIVDTLDNVTRWAKVALDEAWEARRAGTVELMPSMIQAAPGDVLNIPVEEGTLSIRIAAQTAASPGPIHNEGKAWSAHVYGQPYTTSAPAVPPTVSTLEVPLFQQFQTVSVFDENVPQPGVWLAASALPADAWAGAVFNSPDNFSGLGNVDLPVRAVMGTTLESLPLGQTDDFDLSRALQLHATQGALANALATTPNANILIVGERVLRFLNATQSAAQAAAGNWTILGIKDGLFGSDYVGTVPAGTPWVLLSDAIGAQHPGVVWNTGDFSQIGQMINYYVQADDEGPRSADSQFPLNGTNLLPLAPINCILQRNVGAPGAIYSERQTIALADNAPASIPLSGAGLNSASFARGATAAQLKSAIEGLLATWANKVTVTQSGQANEVQNIATGSGYAGGAIALTGASSTQNIVPGDSLASIAAKIEAAQGLAAGSVQVSGSSVAGAAGTGGIADPIYAPIAYYGGPTDTWQGESGTYLVAYTYKNAAGETLISPVANVSLVNGSASNNRVYEGSGQKPINVYVGAKGSTDPATLKRALTVVTGYFNVFTNVPPANAPAAPTANTTGTGGTPGTLNINVAYLGAPTANRAQTLLASSTNSVTITRQTAGSAGTYIIDWNASLGNVPTLVSQSGGAATTGVTITQMIEGGAQNTSTDNTILSGIARSRYVQDADWGTAIAARLADPLQFSIDLNDGTQTKTVLRTATSPGFNFVFSTSELTTLFGAVPAQLSGTVCQISPQAGKGRTRSFTQS